MGKILFSEVEGVFVLKFVADVRVTLGPTLNTFLDELVQCEQITAVVVDMVEATCVDSTALGMLAKIAIRAKEAFDVVPTIVSPNDDITRTLTTMGFESLFVIVADAENPNQQFSERPTEIVSEARLREQVLDAHKVLMAMNEANHAEFRDLVEALEAEGGSATPARRFACN